jgi:hypothetical protein
MFEMVKLPRFAGITDRPDTSATLRRMQFGTCLRLSSRRAHDNPERARAAC